MDESIRQLLKLRFAQAKETLADARFLAAGGRSPSSIINRSYYAMFYAILAMLQSRGLSSSKHGGVIGLFDREFVKAGIFDKSLSKSLHRAFELRQRSEYQEVDPPTAEEAADVLLDAERFVEAAEGNLTES